MPVTVKGSGGGGVTLDSGSASANSTLTLPNTTGTVALTASPTFSGAVTATTVTSPSATALTIQSAGTTAMTVDTSQNVGIGTTSPGAKLNAYNNSAVVTELRAGNSVSYASILVDATGASQLYAPGGTQIFSVGGSERMRIDSSGNLLVGTTSTIISGPKLHVSAATAGAVGAMASVNTNAPTKKWSYGPDGGGNFLVYNDASVGLYVLYGNTSWSTSSDERLKTDLVPITDAAAKVLSLRAVTGRYKTDEEGKSRSFLIAQDVQSVLPEAVDASNPDALGVQYTEVIPLLVAAIQELSAKNDALEARLAALEAK